MFAITPTAETGARPGLFYGWRVVLVSALGLFLGPIPISVFSFAVFLQPLAQEFRVGRGAISLARTVQSAILPLGLPFAGQLLDRCGPRRVILPSMIVAGSVLLSAYFFHWKSPAALLFLPGFGSGHLRSGTTAILRGSVALVRQEKGLGFGHHDAGFGCRSAHHAIGRSVSDCECGLASDLQHFWSSYSGSRRSGSKRFFSEIGRSRWGWRRTASAALPRPLRGPMRIQD
jgi:hypothetical protein